MSSIKVVKRSSVGRMPKHDGELGLRQHLQRWEKENGGYDAESRELLGNRTLVRQASDHFLQELTDGLRSAGAEEPIELSFRELRVDCWVPLLQAAVKPSGIDRFNSRFVSIEILLEKPLVFLRSAGTGTPRVRVLLDGYRLCDWRLEELLDGDRWWRTWDWWTRRYLEQLPELNLIQREQLIRAYREKLGRQDDPFAEHRGDAGGGGIGSTNQRLARGTGRRE